jgi:DNA-binding transcriptional LysR family regulator
VESISGIAMADIRRIDLNLLIALDVLLDERSVTRAAEHLALTQPTVSGMLRRLRQLLGDPLFVRTPRGILPTPRAEALAGPLKRLLADAEALVAAERFDPANAERTFTISTTDYMQYAVVMPFVGALRRAAPGIRLAIRPLAIADLAGQLMRGETDLAITIPEFAAPDLVSRPLYRERYVAAVRKKHPLARARGSLEEFCRFDHILVSPTGGGFKGPVDDALATLGKRRNVTISVPSFLLVPPLLRTCDLIAVLPERLLHGRERGLRMFVPPLEVPGFDVIAVWHTRMQKDAAHRWLRELLVSVVQAPHPAAATRQRSLSR